jgi:hypothetical protein
MGSAMQSPGRETGGTPQIIGASVAMMDELEQVNSTIAICD